MNKHKMYPCADCGADIYLGSVRCRPCHLLRVSRPASCVDCGQPVSHSRPTRCLACHVARVKKSRSPACLDCGKPFGRNRSKAKRCRPCSREFVKQPRTNRQGYVMLYRPEHPLAMKTGYVLEHRFVLHAAGVEIPRGYHVHHINRVRDDNRLENLEVLTPAEHGKRHRLGACRGPISDALSAA